MSITRSDILRWLEDSKSHHTHMLVVCDTFDYEDYPVHTSDVRESIRKYQDASMQTIMEVYDLSMDFGEQLDTHRAWNT